MSETTEFTEAKCQICGALVGMENGERMDTCACDPRCQICHYRFLLRADSRDAEICPSCLDEAEDAFTETYPQLYQHLSQYIRSGGDFLLKEALAALRRDLRKELIEK